jgi:hypothetical protein
MTNVIQFPTATDKLDALFAEATANAELMQSLKIDPKKPIKIVRRTLNDVSPAEWDAVFLSSIDRQPLYTK